MIHFANLRTIRRPSRIPSIIESVDNVLKVSEESALTNRLRCPYAEFLIATAVATHQHHVPHEVTDWYNVDLPSLKAVAKA